MEGGGGKWSKEKEKEKEWRDDYDALPIALPHTPVSEATMIRCWEEGARRGAGEEKGAGRPYGAGERRRGAGRGEGGEEGGEGGAEGAGVRRACPLASSQRLSTRTSASTRPGVGKHIIYHIFT